MEVVEAKTDERIKNKVVVYVKEEKESKDQVTENEELKKKSFLEAVQENPALLAAFVPIVGSLISVVGSFIQTIANNGQHRVESCYVKDDVTGQNYLVKHPLTNNEILELSQRKKNSGETTGEALSDMNVLKKEKRRR